ncbi:MAG: radical SAM family heme chaperone HemW [Hyphomicrobiales bacterium]|nr:radical SAM family heme chaperone HemW [Hyphomicrobiales bacterium]
MIATNKSPGTPEIGFGLYVHWPYCLAKCPYCDFNSHVHRGAIDHEMFAGALVRELAYFAERTPGRVLTSIFFGGGTPSLMPPQTVTRILEAADDTWTFADYAEITLEANPTSAEAGNFRGYRSAGVNRVSVGIQALNDADLKALGRQHSVDEALEAFRMAARIFPQTSFDLIYARPRQTLAGWRDELMRALGEQQGHMSLYQLTIEPDTAFAALHANGKLIVPGDDLAADLYDLTQELTDPAGLPAYEVSNHAWPGRQSRHNVLYWRYGEYAGIGPGAHSRLVAPDGGRIGLNTVRDPKEWLAQVDDKGHGVHENFTISADEAARERLLMGLRLNDGIVLSDFDGFIDADRMHQLMDHGLLANQTTGRLATTPTGRKVLNAVIRELVV